MKSIACCIDEGHTAKIDGKQITSCPYSLKSHRSRDRRMWWHKGFMKKIEKIPTEFNKHRNSCSLKLSFMGNGAQSNENT